MVAIGVSGYSVDMALCPLAAQEIGTESDAAERGLVTRELSALNLAFKILRSFGYTKSWMLLYCICVSMNTCGIS